MSIVRAVRVLTDSLQGLPEAARREVVEILDELEGKTPAPVASLPPEGEDTAQIPAEASPAPFTGTEIEESQPPTSTAPEAEGGSDQVSAPESA